MKLRRARCCVTLSIPGGNIACTNLVAAERRSIFRLERHPVHCPLPGHRGVLVMNIGDSGADRRLWLGRGFWAASVRQLSGLGYPTRRAGKLTSRAMIVSGSSGFAISEAP